MDNPPPNYNPNDSMLSGGVDMPIMKVMGGGSREANALQSSLVEKGFNVMLGGNISPPGYNETVSMLDGGTEPIVMVHGGAVNPTIGDMYKCTDKQNYKTTWKVIDTSDSKKLSLELIRAPGAAPSGFKVNYDRNDFANECVLITGGTTGTTTASSAASSANTASTADTPPESPRANIKPDVVTQPDVVTLPATPEPLTQPDADIKEHNINVRFVSHLNDIDQKLKDKFLSKITNIKDVNAKLQRRVDAKAYINMSYIKTPKNTYDAVVVSLNKETVQIKYIPTNTREIVVLPKVITPNDFLKQLLFLSNNKYIKFNEKKEILLKKKTFLVHLIDPKILINDEINYLYLRLKVSNVDKYYIADYPYKLIYPQYINKKILYISNENLKKPQTKYLNPIDLSLILKSNIRHTSYDSTNDEYNDEFLVVKTGSPDSTDIANPILLSTSIAILEVSQLDYNTITFDINGNTYNIRVPDGKNDLIYNLWLNGKYTPSEEQLINDLKITKTSYLNNKEKIAEILFELAYFKCFNDVSLLTHAECSSLRHTLQVIYKNKLKGEADLDYSASTNDIKEITKQHCYAVEVGSKIICEIEYKTADKSIRKKIVNIPYADNINAIRKPKDEKNANQVKNAIMKAITNNLST